VSRGIEVGRPEGEDLPANEDEQLTGAGGGLVAGLAGFAEHLPDLGRVGGQGTHRQADAAVDDREEVVEVVGDAAGQPANGLQLAGL
jgi:hypothetical protein